MESAVGAVLGPRPGKAICSFWQGNVEILLRILSLLLGSIPALIAAAVSVGVYNNEVLDSTSIGNISEEVTREVRGSAGFVIAIASLAVVLIDLLIILRICNIGLINLNINVFLVVAVIIGIFLLLGHLAGGVACAIYAADSEGVGIDSLVHNTIPEPGNGLVAAAAFCFLSVFLYGFMVIWDIIFMAKEWNDTVVKYTIKEAVTG